MYSITFTKKSLSLKPRRARNTYENEYKMLSCRLHATIAEPEHLRYIHKSLFPQKKSHQLNQPQKIKETKPEKQPRYRPQVVRRKNPRSSSQ